MSVEVRNGGLSWEARIETDRLEQDATKVESIFSGLRKKQIEEEKKLLAGISKNYTEVYQDGLRAFQGLSPQMQKQISILQSFETELIQVGRAQRQLDSDFRKGTITQSQYEKASAGLVVRTQELNSNIQKYTNTIRANQAVMNAANGSIDQKKAKLAQLQTQLNSLSESELKNARIGGQVRAQISALEKDLGKLDRAYRTTGKGNALFNQVLLATSGFLTITQGSRLVKDIAIVRGEIEQLEVAFATMLRSKSAADSLMKDIVDVSLTTPFKLTEVATATKSLLAYGFAQKEVKDELIAIGNVASGVGSTFQEVAYAYGTLRTQGRAFARDIRQFTTRGIPIVGELAKQFGVTEKEINEMVSAGKIGFPEVQKSFQAMTSEGGIFFNLMEKQSQTLTGEIAKLQDKLQLMFNEIGKNNTGTYKAGIQGLTFLVENYQDVIDVIKVLVITYGTYRAALVLTAVAQAAFGASSISLARTLVVLRRVVLALNVALAANPYALVAGALALLIGSFLIFNDEVVKAESAQSRLNKIGEESAKIAGEQESKVRGLVSVLHNQNAADSVRLKAYEDLKAISPDIVKGLTFEEAKTKDLTAAIYQYIDAQAKRVKAEKLTEEGIKLAGERVEAEQKLIEAQQKLNAEKERGERRRSAGELSNVQLAQADVNLAKKNLETIVQAEKGVNEAIKNGFEQTQDGIKTRIAYLEQLKLAVDDTSEAYKRYEDEITALSKSLTITENEPIRNKAYFEKIIEDNTLALEDLDKGAKDFKTESTKYKKAIQSAQKELEAFGLKADNKAAKESLTEREKVLEQIQTMEDKAYKRGFDKREQQIEDTRRQYEDLRNAARDAGLGKGVLDRIDRLEQTDTGNINYRTDTEELKEEFDKRKVIYQQYEQYVRDFGVKAANDKYSAELDIARNYLGKVQLEYDKLTAIKPEDRSGVEIERLRVVQDILEKEKAEQSAAYDQLLLLAENYNQKREVLESNYQKDRAKILSSGDSQYLEEFERQYRLSLQELNKEAFLDSSGYTQFFDNIETMSRDAALNGVDVLLEKLEEMSEVDLMAGGLSPEDIAKLKAQLLLIKKNINQELPAAMLEWARSLDEIAGNLSQIDGEIGRIIGSVSAVIKGFAQVKGLTEELEFAKGTEDPLDNITATVNLAALAANSIINIFNLISQASKQRQEAEEKYYKSVTGYQADYNMALVEQLRLQTSMNENVFLTDYQGKIEDGYNSLNEATKGYQEAIEKLGEARVKSGTKKSVDWGNVGSAAAQGAVAGAAIGSIIPVIGNAVGLVVGGLIGGIAGLFGGKKNKDTYVSLLDEFPDLIKQSEDGLLEVNKQMAEALLANDLLDEGTKELITDVVKWGEEIEKAKEQINGAIGDLVGQVGGELRNVLVEAFRAGTDAGVAMTETISKAIENMVSQLLFAAILGDNFDQLQKDLAKSYDPTSGDQNPIDDFADFFKEMEKDVPVFNQGLKDFQQMGDAFGFDLFKPADQAGSGSGATGIQGGIQRSITEETGAELAGLFRGFYDISKQSRTGIYEHLTVANQQLTFLQQISTNTLNTVDRLDAAVVELKTISKNTKPGQGGRDTGWGG